MQLLGKRREHPSGTSVQIVYGATVSRLLTHFNQANGVIVRAPLPVPEPRRPQPYLAVLVPQHWALPGRKNNAEL